MSKSIRFTLAMVLALSVLLFAFAGTAGAAGTVPSDPSCEKHTDAFPGANFWTCYSHTTVVVGRGVLFAQAFGESKNQLFVFVNDGEAFVEVCFPGGGIVTANHFPLFTYSVTDGNKAYSCAQTWVDGNTTFFELVH